MDKPSIPPCCIWKPWKRCTNLLLPTWIQVPHICWSLHEETIPRFSPIWIDLGTYCTAPSFPAVFPASISSAECSSRHLWGGSCAQILSCFQFSFLFSGVIAGAEPHNTHIVSLHNKCYSWDHNTCSLHIMSWAVLLGSWSWPLIKHQNSQAQALRVVAHSHVFSWCDWFVWCVSNTLTVAGKDRGFLCFSARWSRR